jgi:hypothetical protein
MTEIRSTAKGVRGWASADKRARGVNNRGGGALTERTQRQGMWVLTDGPGRRARVREAVSRDLGHAIKIGRGRSDRGGERLRAAPLLSSAMKSPELGRVRAMAVPGSPELVREGEDDTAISMAGLWPRVRGQRGGHGRERASGGPEELR